MGCPENIAANLPTQLTLNLLIALKFLVTGVGNLNRHVKIFDILANIAKCLSNLQPSCPAHLLGISTLSR